MPTAVKRVEIKAQRELRTLLRDDFLDLDAAAVEEGGCAESFSYMNSDIGEPLLAQDAPRIHGGRTSHAARG